MRITASIALMLIMNLLWSVSARGAIVVRVNQGEFWILKIYLTKRITDADVQILHDGTAVIEKLAKDEGKRIVLREIFLRSEGGDVQAAMTIGRWARKNDAWAQVLDQGGCISACVFVLAGATTRSIHPNARIGVHRPYFAKPLPNLSYDQVRAKQRAADEEMAKYLDEMDIPLSLLTQMQAVPSQKVRFLSWEEQDKFRLASNDRTAQEQSDAYIAEHFKMSREEYYRRLNRVRKVCGKVSTQGGIDYFDCHQNVMRRRR